MLVMDARTRWWADDEPIWPSRPGALEDAEPAAPRPRIAWIELSCLVCGEVAGHVEDRRIVRPILPGGIRLERGRLRCGRCGGVLLSGERGTSRSRAGIG